MLLLLFRTDSIGGGLADERQTLFAGVDAAFKLGVLDDN